MRFCPTCGNRYEGEQYCPEDGVPTQPLPDEGPKVDPLLNRVLDGRYRVEKQIGEGGMGIVYLARHTVLGKKLAIKVLRGDMAKDKDLGERFQQEARSASEIGHPNIIDITDFGTLPDGTVYFVMEMLEGESLTDMIGRGGSIPMQDALTVIRQVASALGAAHARGIVHRDLKPDNIFLIKRGDNPLYVKVLDFGIAKIGGAASKLTKTGVIFGTPHYMSPEQAAGQPIDARTDIYALGVIMYEMFTGRVPFDADTFMGILTKHMFETPKRPSELGAGDRLGAIEDVVMKALAKKPEQRYQTMEELIADCDRVAAGGTVQLGRGGIPAPNSLADALEPPTRTEMDLGRSLPRSRAPVIALAAIGLLVLVGGAGLAFGIGGDDRPTPTAALTPLPPTKTPPPSTPPSAPAAAPPASVPSEEMIEVRTDPPGAAVMIDGALVGNTPVGVPKPATGESATIEIRMSGYETQQMRLSHMTQATITVPLTRERQAARGGGARGGGARRGGNGTGGGTATSPPSKAPPPDRPPPRRSEVVDPWAN